MSHTRLVPVRLLAAVPLVLTLVVTMFAAYTVSPALPKANAALISSQKANSAVDWARSRKGSPYGYGADGPHRFDCSGLTRWVYSKVRVALQRHCERLLSEAELRVGSSS